MPLGTRPSLREIAQFFGSGDRLSAFRRNGGIVPDIPANAAISTTNAGLKQSQFTGADKTVPTAPVYLSSGTNPASDSGSGADEKIGDMFAATMLTPSGGNGSYSYSTSIVSTSGSVRAGTVVISFSGNSMRCACQLGSAASGQTITGSVVVDVTVTSGTSTATLRQTYNFSWRNAPPK